MASDRPRKWAEAGSLGPEGLPKFGLQSEGTGEPQKACQQGCAWKPEAFPRPEQGLREAEPETAPLPVESGCAAGTAGTPALLSPAAGPLPAIRLSVPQSSYL